MKIQYTDWLGHSKRVTLFILYVIIKCTLHIGVIILKKMRLGVVMAVALWIGVSQVDADQINNAASNGNTAEVRRLLQAGADVNATFYGWTALMSAAHAGYPDVVRELLQFPGIEIDVKDGGGYTALMRASSRGYKEIVEQLLQAGANVNAENRERWTPLMLAASLGYPDVVSQLIQAGAVVNAKCTGEWTALMLAAKYGHLEIVKRLLQFPGIDVNLKNSGGQTALDLAANEDIKQLIQERINGK